MLQLPERVGYVVTIIVSSVLLKNSPLPAISILHLHANLDFLQVGLLILPRNLIRLTNRYAVYKELSNQKNWYNYSGYSATPP